MTDTLAPTAKAVGISGWLDGSTAPKDGTEIVAVGRVIWKDDCTTSVDGFVAAIRWLNEPWMREGWHDRGGLSVARMLEDEVLIDWWMPMPSNAPHEPPTPKPR